jgi:hypothetical protein
MPAPILVELLVFTLMASSAFAGPFDDVKAAYQRGDYATALKILQPLADGAALPLRTTSV